MRWQGWGGVGGGRAAGTRYGCGFGDRRRMGQALGGGTSDVQERYALGGGGRGKRHVRALRRSCESGYGVLLRHRLETAE